MPPCNKEQRQPELECDIPLHNEAPVPVIQKPVEPAKPNTKSSIHLELGTYQAAFVPLFVLLCTTIWVGVSFDTGDDNESVYTTKTLVCSAINALYILVSVTWGPRFMKAKEPIKPKKLIMVYNAFQVVFCSKILYTLLASGWTEKINWFCQPTDLSHNPTISMVKQGVNLYFWSKVLDFTDTFFFILSKKWNHISLLHVIHHSGMCLITFGLSMSTPAGHQTLTVYINSLVHIVMYTYYFLAAMGPTVQPYLWWKRYLTRMQLVQFIIVLFHNLQVFFNGCSQVPRTVAGLFVVYSIGFFVLFADFYLKEYRHKVKIHKETPKSATPVDVVSKEKWN